MSMVYVVQTQIVLVTVLIQSLELDYTLQITPKLAVWLPRSIVVVIALLMARLHTLQTESTSAVSQAIWIVLAFAMVLTVDVAQTSPSAQPVSLKVVSAVGVDNLEIQLETATLVPPLVLQPST
jgi:uncharacterized membrane protein YhaH (DUF805 family)